MTAKNNALPRNELMTTARYAYSGALICIRATGFVTHSAKQKNGPHSNNTRPIVLHCRVLTGFLCSAKWSANRKIIPLVLDKKETESIEQKRNTQSV